MATTIHPCFWSQYWGYAETAWFEYLDEFAVEAPFKIQAENTDMITTHIHRPLQSYISGLLECSFVFEKFIEMTGEGFELPRFVAFRVRKETGIDR